MRTAPWRRIQKEMTKKRVDPIKRTVQVVIERRPDQAVELTVDVIVNGHRGAEPIIVEIPPALPKKKGKSHETVISIRR